MRQARNCWPVLVRKAQDAVNEAQSEIAQALARVEQLQASHARLCTLYDEYRLQENQSDGPVMGMQASMNHRQFMAQLLTLQQRVVVDLSKAQVTLSEMRKKESWPRSNCTKCNHWPNKTPKKSLAMCCAMSKDKWTNWVFANSI